MSKRCTRFARRARDLYLTPASAVAPLARHLLPGRRFVEPCAADGGLVRHLEALGHRCVGAFDIAPLAPSVYVADARDLDLRERGIEADEFITNSPWTRDLLHAIIDALSWQAPLWNLFDADWAHTRQAERFLPHCSAIVSVGRVKWVSDTPYTGKDNAAWYRFAPGSGPPIFYGRGTAASHRDRLPTPQAQYEPAQ